MYTRTIALCVAAVLTASPVLGSCPVLASSLQVPSGQTALVAPSYPPDFVALGVGVQNYTCSSTSTYTNIGAVAELFDISCLASSSIFPSLTTDVEALWNAVPSNVVNTTDLISIANYLGNPDVLGQHYFIVNPVTGSGTSPEFDFTSARFKGVEEAFVVLGRTGDIPSPEDSADNIDWLYLTALSYPGQGELARFVFRVDTAGGQPPSSCSGTDSISVKYAAKYYLYNTTLPSSVLNG